MLFLSAAVGAGHTAAARAVAGALRERDPSIEIETVDSYRYAASIFAKVVADGYLSMVKTVPQLYGMIYDRVERAERVPAARRFVSRYAATNLHAYIARTQPDLVACTHAFPCGVMSSYKTHFDRTLPVVGIVTDFVVHRYWMYSNVDAYAVATPEMAQSLLRHGVGGHSVIASGIPVDARFGRPSATAAQLRVKLGLPLDRPIVLIMGGGLGFGPIERAIDAMATLRQPAYGAVIAGRNRPLELRARARALRLGAPVVVRGFVDNIDEYMHAADVLITKPGGLTTAEALAAQTPMLLVDPLPGQEQRNARYLVSHGAAFAAPGKDELGMALERVLGSPGERDRVRRNAATLRKPDAAGDVAGRIIALLAERRGRLPEHRLAANALR